MVVQSILINDDPKLFFSKYPYEDDRFYDFKNKIIFEIKTAYDKNSLKLFIDNIKNKNAMLYESCINIDTKNDRIFKFKLETVKYKENNQILSVSPKISKIDVSYETMFGESYIKYTINFDLSESLN
jgi:hypothetical protein